ncbi:aminotransferase class V-fold PLP-dependent enzyme [Brucella abortus]|nr:aminotransferase class V-fold PLP-dependent enzyme [Brucella abortus]
MAFHTRTRSAKLAILPIQSTITESSTSKSSAKRLSERTKLVAITHMSNTLSARWSSGSRRSRGALAHARGVPVLVDGSQGAVHLPVVMQDLGRDWYVSTGHSPSALRASACFMDARKCWKRCARSRAGAK